MAHEIERDWTTGAGLRAVCLLITGSHRCGYVEVPKGHPLHGVGYSDPTDVIVADLDAVPLGAKSPILLLTAGVGAAPNETIRRSPDVLFDVHGGLTYAGGDGYPVKDSDGWWFGFDCAHAGDGSLAPRFAEWRTGPVRSEEYVVGECERLARQIVEMVVPVTNGGADALEEEG